MSFEYADIPAELRETCATMHEALVEAAAEANEELMEKYLDEQTSDRGRIKEWLAPFARWRTRLCRYWVVRRSRIKAFRRCSMR